MSSTLSIINRLLPFATPGTPLVQDLVHLAAICLLLYLAPQIQDRLRQGSGSTAATSVGTTEHEAIEDDNNTDQARHEEPQTPHEVVDQVNNHAQQAAPQADANEDDEADEAAADDAGIPAERNVGAKKAKSLARKDQRRAYNEFMRSQGDAQRARDAEGAAERDAALEAEKNRRALVEAELVAKKAREREQKREAEQAEREAEYRRRETAVAIVKADLIANNMSDLHKVAVQAGGDVDEEWVEKVIQAAGITGRKDNVFTMITTSGWAVRITEQDARTFYQQAANIDISDEHGYMNDSKVSEMLVSVLSSNEVAAGA